MVASPLLTRRTRCEENFKNWKKGKFSGQGGRKIGELKERRCASVEGCSKG